MKKLILTLSIACVVATVMAQAPQKFSYQGVARDNAGNTLVNQNIGLQLTIHRGSPTGLIEYRETQASTTNAFGLFNIQVGGGTVVQGEMLTINWGGDDHYLQVEMDATGGTSYQDMGTSQLLSVPYALYAETTADQGAFPAGQLGETMWFNGTEWVADSTIFNDGEHVAIGAPSTQTFPPEFYVHGDCRVGEFLRVDSTLLPMGGIRCLTDRGIEFYDYDVPGVNDPWVRVTADAFPQTHPGLVVKPQYTPGGYRVFNVVNGSGDLMFHVADDHKTRVYGTMTADSVSVVGRLTVIDSFAEAGEYVATIRNTSSGPYANGLLIRAGQNSQTVNNRFISFQRTNGAEIGAIRQVTTNGVDYNTTSDERLKTNITPTAKGLQDLMQIEVKDYVYKEDMDKPQTGFIAQQVFEHYPSAVSVGGDDAKTDPWMMDYGKLTPLLVKAVQDQQQLISEQQAQIETLKEQNRMILETLRALQNK